MASEEAIGGPMRSIVARLETLSERESLALQDILDAFGSAGYLPLLMVLALVVVSPLSGIPLLPTAFGLAIALVSAQALVGVRHVRLPRWLARRRLSGRGLQRGMARLGRAADWVDRRARRRLSLLVRPPFDLLPRVAMPLCGGAMPFLELVPFSSSVLASAVVLFATALLTQDGLFVLAGLALLALGASIPMAVYGGVISAL